MLKSYILSAYQNLIRDKLFSVINIIGLAIGFSIFTLISLYVESEYSYDTQWENSERIYIVTDFFKVNEQLSFKQQMTPYPALPALVDYFPDAFELTARRIFRGDHFIIDETRFEGRTFLVEKDFINIFDLEVVSGSLENTMASSGNIALNEERATAYFGNENPIGKTISINVPDVGLIDYQVSAVFRIPEGGTSLSLPSFALLDEAAISELSDKFTLWSGGINNVMNYFLLKPGVNIEAMNQQLGAFVNQYYNEPWRILDENTQMSDFHPLKFEKLTDSHFDKDLRNQSAGDKTKIQIFSLIGLLVLLIGSTNFVILTTAKANNRRKEVGIRKVLGANKQQLISQFIGEALLLCFIAFLVALGITALSSSFFANLIGSDLPLNVFTPLKLALLLLVTIIVGILGGLYPAFVLSSFDAVKIFKPFTKNHLFSLRSALVTFQFAIAITLVIATLVTYSQLTFFKNRDLGFDPENLFIISLNSTSAQEAIEPLSNELSKLAEVESLGQSGMPPNRMGMGYVYGGTYLKDKSGENEAAYTGAAVGYDFLKTLQIPIIAGRHFDRSLDPIIQPEENDADSNGTDTNETEFIPKLIINKTLSDAIGFPNPDAAINQLIYQSYINQDKEINYNALKIIGVVEDVYFQSFREAPQGESFTLRDTYFTTIAIRTNTLTQAAFRDKVETIWSSIIQDAPLMLNSVSQNVDLEFMKEENESKILATFSALAIFISCIGLYGLASFIIKSKIKEIGIRKVLGAKFKSILAMFIWQFCKPVIVAIIIAYPIALYAMLKWLQSFPEQMDYMLLLPIFLSAAIIALLIACLTVSASTAKAAKADPVKSLRYE